MRNILEIERGLIRDPEIATGLQLRAVATIQRSLKTAETNKLKKSLELGRKMSEVLTWFNQSETQQKFSNAGISWGVSELADKVFEVKKPWFYKCIKASNIEQVKLDSFLEQAKALQSAGENVKIGIEPLNQFVKATDNAISNGETPPTLEQIQQPAERNQTANSVVNDTDELRYHSIDRNSVIEYLAQLSETDFNDLLNNVNTLRNEQ